MKKQIKIEDVYELIPYYITEDAGLPLSCTELSSGQVEFFNDLIRFAIDEARDGTDHIVEDLQMIKSDLEAVLEELGK